MAEFDDVVITAELARRPARTSDFERECRALVSLSRAIADAPESVLQRLVETAVELCQVATAGISLLEEHEGQQVFRWHAIAGKHAHHLMGMTPRDFSPCGIVIEENSPQLFSDPGRRFPSLANLDPPIAENLLIPFYISNRAVGTIWLISHSSDRKFDAEDVRIMSDLADFCAAALHAVHTVDAPGTSRTLANQAIEAQPSVRREIERRKRLTDRRVEAARQQGEQKFRLLVQNITDYAMMMLDLEGRITAWNEGAARLKQYDEAEILGQHVSIFYPPEELAAGRPQQEMAAARATDRSEVEGYRVRKDGTRFWANEIITPIRNEAGEQVGYAKISRDLTVQKNMRDALQESEARNRLLIENARDYAIMMVDVSGRIVSWNTGAERVFGHSGAEIIGQRTKLLFTPEDQASGQDEKELATAASEGRAVDERWQLRKGGERFWASGVTTAMRDADGALYGFAKICRDLTEQQQLKEQRERLFEQEKTARMEAERAVRMKDEFLAMVSHELRTPLTAILLWSKLVRIGAVDEAGRPEAMEAIEQSALAQQQLVDDLLDISRIVSGKLRVHLRDSEVRPVVEAAVETVRPMAEAKEIDLRVAIDERVGSARIDPDRVQQVLWNLLNNAVKFTERGGRVDLAVELAEDRLVMRARDTGIGISSEFLPHVFEVFRQADSGTTRQHGGLGLGMAIARQLMELHGGSIRAESAGEGQGATFTIELPITKAIAGEGVSSRTLNRPPAPLKMRPVLRGLRVLLVEDERNTRLVLERLLQGCAADVATVESAAQAVARFREAHHNGSRFDVIISDIGMPVEDGYELMRELRTMERARGEVITTPAIALTAYARPDDRARAEQAGYQLHLSKPIDPDKLIAAVGALTGRAT